LTHKKKQFSKSYFSDKRSPNIPLSIHVGTSLKATLCHSV
jgi:hypothetical protein